MKKAALIILFFIPALLYSCGGPEWRNTKQKQDLELSDWKFDEDRYFTECPAIAGCDEDGDCLMNVHDSNVTEFDDWRTVCESLATCMQEYTDDYDECIGGDFEELRRMAGAPTLEEFFKGDSDIVQVVTSLLLVNFGPYINWDQDSSGYLKKSNKRTKTPIDTVSSIRVIVIPPDETAPSNEDQQNAYSVFRHGENGIEGPFEFTYEMSGTKNCSTKGEMGFGKNGRNMVTPTNNGEIGGYLEILINDDESTCDAFKNEYFAGGFYTVTMNSTVSIIPLMADVENDGFKPPEIAMLLAMKIDQLGCYPYGGRDNHHGQTIPDGQMVTYANYNDMKKADTGEIGACNNWFKDKECNYNCIFQDRPLNAGVITEFTLEGVEDNDPNTKVTMKFKRKKESADTKSPIPYCFSSKIKNKESVVVFAEKTSQCTAAVPEEDDPTLTDDEVTDAEGLEVGGPMACAIEDQQDVDNYVDYMMGKCTSTWWIPDYVCSYLVESAQEKAKGEGKNRKKNG